MPSGHAYTKAFRTCKTCVGTRVLPLRRRRQHGARHAIEQRFQGIESPAKMKLATAGCPRNCSEATMKDIGAVAIEGGRWEIYVGGAAGAHVRKGDILCTVDIARRGAHAAWAASCSTTASTRSTSSAPTTSCRASASSGCARVLVDDAEGHRRAARRRRCRRRSTRTSIRGSRRDEPVHPSQFAAGARAGGGGGRRSRWRR